MVLLPLLSVVAAASYGFRPPAVPLIVQDPYTNLWSNVDTLNQVWSTEWSGAVVGMVGMVKVDNQYYCWMGDTSALDLQFVTPAVQTGLEVVATKTSYTFVAGPVTLNVSFRTPSGLAPNVGHEVLSLPVTYVDFSVENSDGGQHEVKVYLDTTAEIALSDTSSKVTWSRGNSREVEFVTLGNAVQRFNNNNNANQINWGRVVLGYRIGTQGVVSVGNPARGTRDRFASGGSLPKDAPNNPTPNNVHYPVAAVAVGVSDSESSTIFVAYDDGSDVNASVFYFGMMMQPYWRYAHKDMEGVLDFASQNKPKIDSAMDAFDRSVVAFTSSTGSDEYAVLCSLVYRQVTGALKTVHNTLRNETWVFLKELSPRSGGINTVDVIYAASPLFAYHRPEVLRELLLPVLAYANNETDEYGKGVKYNLSWAPHNLGVWPTCDLGPEGQEQMPVEETGNMLIMVTLVTLKGGGPSWLAPYWPLLQGWAEYLIDSLPDPGNQTCSDDFEGPSPHNANLAAKGIVALRAYAELLNRSGQAAEAQKFARVASNYSEIWVAKATDASGAHTKRQYDLEGTWSQKYNLLYQQVFGFDSGLIPPSLLQKDIAFMMEKQLNTYGVPLDNRGTITKTDWSMWIAAMGSAEQFSALVHRLYLWANTTNARTPFSDLIDTKTPGNKGFRALPAVAGFWARMLLSLSA